MSVEVAPYAPTSVLETLPCSLPIANIAEDVNLDELGRSLVQPLHGLSSSDLVKDAVWRDLFALTGTVRTFYSSRSVANAWSETCFNRKAKGFAFVPGSGRLIHLSNGVAWAEIMFNFQCEGTPSTICSGFLNLIPDLNGLWRIWMIRTILEQLEGCSDVDQLRTEGSVRQQVNGIDVPAETTKPQINGSTSGGTVQAGATTNFDVAIIGAGQAGLGIAGRLQALGVRYVVLDKHAQIGMNWLTRYESTRLHTAREYNHLPFNRTFPLPYQEFLTKFDIAKGYKEWINLFGINKHIRFSTTVVSGNWNDAQRFWSLDVRREATVELLTCRHVVMATGAGGQNPVMPTFPGSDLYQGTVLHSAQYHDAKSWRGKSGIVIGTANTAHDVAKDMAEAGLSNVTMVQRTRTYVLPTEYFTKITQQAYNLDIPIEVADKAGYSLPYGVMRLLSMKTMHAMAKEEPERFDALERAGFRVERYGDIIWHICEKMGGHYMDVGCSDMIARGLIKMKSDALPDSYTRTGLLFSDGTEISADVIVFCTGFLGNMRTDVRNLFGSHVADKVDDFWTLDDEGELKGAFKPTGHPGLWYIGGTISHARYFSRHLALQIKADLMGARLPIYDGERQK